MTIHFLGLEQALQYKVAGLLISFMGQNISSSWNDAVMQVFFFLKCFLKIVDFF